MSTQAIQWPKAKIGEAEYTFRMSYSAWQQLLGWGIDISADIPLAAYAAAQAGNYTKTGKWKSAGWKSWVDVADEIGEMSSADQAALHDAVLDALKKAQLDVIEKAQSDPAPTAP